MQRFCAVKTTAQTSRWMTEGSTADEFMNKERTEAASPTDSIAPSSVTTKSSLDLDAPNTWIDTTDPFIVARYYALDDVTAEEIKSKLDLNGITSLELLLQAFLDLNIRWKNKIGAQMFKNMTAAIRRSQTRPTELLGGKLDFDRTCITEKLLRLYAPKAVSVIESRYFDETRFPNFTLVMGPSGSGKTMFAMEHLPTIVFSEATSLEEIFRVHLTARTLVGDSKDELDLPTLLVNHVQNQVAYLLREYRTDGIVVPPINLFLFVVIDEAGSAQYKRYFDKANKIEKLVTALHSMKKFKFVKGVHVTVTGTGLETSTDGIDPNVETIKFRMQPWSLSNFYALLNEMKRSDEEKIKGIVMCYPILQSLTTNARCAYFLADSMPDLTARSPYQWSVYVDSSVVNVAQRYVASNALSHVKDRDKEKFTVAQEVFKALDEAMSHPNVALFPSFDHIKDATYRSVTQSLLDIYVENINGKAELVGKRKYSVSVTPAVAVVLVELLCGKSNIRWNQHGLETAAALGEWKRMITEMEVSDFSSECGVTYMRSSVPVCDATSVRFTLPLVGISTVLVNVPAAPYADVMAPYRLVQTRVSVNTQEDLQLDFAAELGQLGLTKDPSYRLEQAVTSVLYTMWPTLRPEVRYNYIGVTAGWDREQKEDARFEHYPIQALRPGYTEPPETASFVLDEERLYVLPDDNDGEATPLITKKPIKILEEFVDGRPVTAVFVTNAKRFVLEKKKKMPVAEAEQPAANKPEPIFKKRQQTVAVNERQPNIIEDPAVYENQPPVTIGKDDVDWRGVLKKPLPGYLVGNLRNNVEVRFIFY
jgi:hypothetical protein